MALLKQNVICKLASIVGSLVLLSGCEEQIDKPEDIVLAEQNLPETIDYNWHVRPILSDSCFACHGPQADAEAGLQLHTKEAATAELTESPGKFAITPGDLRNSEIYHRLVSGDPSYHMPPPESHITLSSSEKATIIRWIEQGADYKPHWAFLSPEKVASSEVKQKNWPRNEIDHFILERLERENIEPSGVASKESLIRRVTFGLTGLPPTLNEMDAFLKDTRPDAYKYLIERLLASPAYGERMAAYWMDVARYADSDGYLDDKHRVLYPWRDWVIDAFNANMTFDDFVTWQIAGDLLPDATNEQILATAFNRLHKKNSEAGIDFEEFRVANVADRTDTFGTAFLGLTIGCARCHDHKFDPVTHEDYYELFSFFNSTNELGTAVFGPGQTPGPSLLLSSDEDELAVEQLNSELSDIERDYLQAKADALTLAAKKPKVSVTDIEASINNATTAHYGFDEMVKAPGNEKGIWLSASSLESVGAATLSEPKLVDGVVGKAFYLTDYNTAKLADKVGWNERTDAFSFELWVKPGKVYDAAAVFHNSEGLRVGYKGYSLHLKENRLRFLMAHSWPTNAIDLHTKDALPAQQWSHIVLTYDGSSRANGVRFYINGEQAEINVDIDKLYKSILFVPDAHTYGFEGVQLGQRKRSLTMKDGAIDELRFYNRSLTPLEVAYRYDADRAISVPSAWEQEYLASFDPSVLSQEKRLNSKREALNQLVTDIQEIMVMGDTKIPRRSFILDRGDFTSPTDEVFPAPPGAVLDFNEDYPRNRIGLAQWLFDESNPLTARVFVNRIWQMHFGEGLVATSDDFGNQGSLPSHPELLDWLAIRFMESGWDIKALHQTIVMSTTYRQSSATRTDLDEIDPENILLARGPAIRLEAEMIRDNALLISGLLVDKQGGEGQYPYQPAGLWDSLSTKHYRYLYPEPEKVGEGLYRRSLYTFVKRSLPPPSMLVFDAASREQCIVERNITSSPLQALVLLNDPQFIEASRKLAERAIVLGSSPDEQISVLHRLTTGREPRVEEASLLATFFEEQRAQFALRPDDAHSLISVGYSAVGVEGDASTVAALTVVANSLLNTDEAVMRR